MSEINEFQRWGNKKAYDEGWLRLWGKECPDCKGGGGWWDESDGIGRDIDCPRCNGIGRIEKERCGVCDGTGYLVDKSKHGEEVKTVCIVCKGKGKC